MNWGGGRHTYYGKTNSRGQRMLSKVHKSLDSGDVDKAFKEYDDLAVKQAKFKAKLKRKGI